MKAIYLILICVFMGVVGQLLLKKGVTQIGQISLSGSPLKFFKVFTNPFVVLGFLGYGLSSFLWLVVISRVPLSYAYPMISISYVLVVLLSSILYKENVNLMRWGGVVLISLGVILISQSQENKKHLSDPQAKIQTSLKINNKNE